MPNKPTTTEALQQITERRRALESLINIAMGVENQHLALSELALAARPSQDFPAKLVGYFKALEERCQNDDSGTLLSKLENVENAINRSIDKIVTLAKVDVNKLRDKTISQIDVDGFKKFIADFKRLTNTSLGLRFVLKKRGVAIAPIKIPLAQEQINQEIEALKEKEKRCVKQIRGEMQQIIKETQTIIATPGLPEPMLDELEKVIQSLMVNIEHLDRGGSINQIPNVFEVVVLSSEPTLGQDENEAEPNEVPLHSEQQELSSDQETDKHKTTDRTSNLSPTRKAYSNWWIFKKWLSSPWKTSWRELKTKYGK